MKPALLALCLLAPSLAGAATFNFNFTKPYNYPVFPCDQIGVVANGGIVASFGRAWSYAPDCDNSPSPCFCWNGYLVTDKAECPAAPAYCTPVYAGDFANEPSGEWAARSNCAFDCEPGDHSCPTQMDFGIRFEPAITYFAISVTGTATQKLWDCDGNLVINEPTYPGSINSGSHIVMIDSLVTPVYSPDHVEADVYIPIEDGTQGIGDPNGHLRHWWRVVVTSPVPIHRVYFAGLAGGPIFWDNLTATTSGGIEPPCPHPPCEFERATQDRETPANRTSWGALKAIYR